MLTDVKLLGAQATVRDVRDLFGDDHVHAAVIVDKQGALHAVIDRDDLEQGTGDDHAAVTLGARRGRTIGVNVDAHEALQLLLAVGRRRTAVIDQDGIFRGLLCLKHSRIGFCSDRDIRARSIERREGSAGRRIEPRVDRELRNGLTS